MTCNCPPRWCYRRKNCRRAPQPLVPDFAAGTMRESKHIEQRGVHSVEQPDPLAQEMAEWLAATQHRHLLDWLNERRRAIEEELQGDLPVRTRGNWEAALVVVNKAIERRSERG